MVALGTCRNSAEEGETLIEMNHNKKLKVKLAINIVICLLGAMIDDSNSVIPLIICGCSAVWILLFIVANAKS